MNEIIALYNKKLTQSAGTYMDYKLKINIDLITKLLGYNKNTSSIEIFYEILNDKFNAHLICWHLRSLFPRTFNIPYDIDDSINNNPAEINNNLINDPVNSIKSDNNYNKSDNNYNKTNNDNINQIDNSPNIPFLKRREISSNKNDALELFNIKYNQNIVKNKDTFFAKHKKIKFSGKPFAIWQDNNILKIIEIQNRHKLEFMNNVPEYHIIQLAMYMHCDYRTKYNYQSVNGIFINYHKESNTIIVHHLSMDKANTKYTDVYNHCMDIYLNWRHNFNENDYVKMCCLTH